MAITHRNTPPATGSSGGSKARSCECGSARSRHLHQRIVDDMYRRELSGGAALMRGAFKPDAPLNMAGSSQEKARPSGASKPRKNVAVSAQEKTDASPPRPLLFKNMRLFDGTPSAPVSGKQVLVEGSKVSDILGGGEKVENARVIDCGGLLLMPGLIDAHWHSMLAALNQMKAMTSSVGYIYLTAAREARETLLRGFTSIRDAGGPSFALKDAIDHGVVEGPRIYPCGAMISQTSGHGDFRLLSDIPRGTQNDLSFIERAGVAMIADGRAQVLRRVREQLMQGATQIKLLVGGGVASTYDTLDSTQFTDAELTAGVAAASDWNTYVMAHVYTAKGIKRAIRNGVRSIEHGQLADEECVKMMQGEGVWWSLQPFLQDEDANAYRDPAKVHTQKLVSEGTARAYEMAQKHKIKTGWGTDVLFNPAKTPTQGHQLAKLTRFYDPLTLLSQATQENGELLALSGARDPYPATLGRIVKGGYADLIIADGDPTKNLDFISDPAANFHAIMKDGKFYKNIL